MRNEFKKAVFLLITDNNGHRKAIDENILLADKEPLDPQSTMFKEERMARIVEKACEDYAEKINIPVEELKGRFAVSTSGAKNTSEESVLDFAKTGKENNENWYLSVTYFPRPDLIQE